MNRFGGGDLFIPVRSPRRAITGSQVTQTSELEQGSVEFEQGTVFSGAWLSKASLLVIIVHQETLSISDHVTCAMVATSKCLTSFEAASSHPIFR
jgi:hypothetical protein